uniref:GRF-type domain-containing protein n=1 Tax=Lactuca sativa TaxID=4236 RepID=A0A9R1W5D9_LACSA|nr:hypothetical protein LSAT_V11C300109430 [Lactuca sativa]
MLTILLNRQNCKFGPCGLPKPLDGVKKVSSLHQREAAKRASSSSLKGFFFFVSRLLLLLRDSKMVLCFCGNVAVVRTSWTSRNPGRRFYACPKMGSRCGFLGWFDPPMCQRSTVIIPGPLRTMNRYEVEVG